MGAEKTQHENNKTRRTHHGSSHWSNNCEKVRVIFHVSAGFECRAGYIIVELSVTQLSRLQKYQYHFISFLGHIQFQLSACWILVLSAMDIFRA